MKNILMCEMLWHLASLDLTKVIVAEDSMVISQQQMRALVVINLLIKDEIIPHIFHLENPHEVWIVVRISMSL